MKLTDFLTDWLNRRSKTVSMRLTDKEKFVIDTLKGSQSYADHYLDLIKYLAGEKPALKKHFKNCFTDDYEERFKAKKM